MHSSHQNIAPVLLHAGDTGRSRRRLFAFAIGMWRAPRAWAQLTCWWEVSHPLLTHAPNKHTHYCCRSENVYCQFAFSHMSLRCGERSSCHVRRLWNVRLCGWHFHRKPALMKIGFATQKTRLVVSANVRRMSAHARWLNAKQCAVCDLFGWLCGASWRCWECTIATENPAWSARARPTNIN